MKQLQGYMQLMLQGNPALCEAVIPKFSVGCRRMTPGIGYLEALQAPNTRVVTEPIKKIVAEGIELISGEVVKLDVIACATGFDVSFRPRFPVIGKNGENLQDRWGSEEPKAYMSLAVDGMPNYFSKFYNLLITFFIEFLFY